MTDVLVIGAGPAGLAAALAARQAGAAVVLLDAADQTGGQYWRHALDGHGADEQGPHRRHALHGQGADRQGPGWARFTALRRSLTADPGCEIVTSAQVWAVGRREGAPPSVHVLVGPADGTGRAARVLNPRALVLATGAHERTLPFPGWDLPGVVTAGAAQAMAKGERVAVGRRVLIAGAGPFLLPVASSLLHLGSRVVGVFEAVGWGALARGWSQRPHELLSVAGKAAELAGYAWELARQKVPYRTGWAVVAAHGTDRVTAATLARVDRDWRPRAGTQRRVAVDAVCVSHGFVPRTELGLASGCAAGPDGALVVDAAQHTTVPGVYAAGEVTGIGGADLALAEGAVAGRCAAGAAATSARPIAVPVRLGEISTEGNR